MLRKKILIQILIIQAMLAALFIGAYFVIYKGYEKLEYKSLEENLSRVKGALDREHFNMTRYNREWALSGGMYWAIRNEEPITLGMRRMFMSNIVGAFNINFGAVFDKEGKLIIARHITNERGMEANLDEDAQMVNYLYDNSNLLNIETYKDSVEGLLKTEDGISFYSAQPITLGILGDSVHGSLVTTSPLSGNTLSQLADRVLMDVDITTIEDFREASTDNKTMVASLLNSENRTIFEPIDRETIGTYMIMNDVNGEPAFVLQIKSKRDIILELQSTIATTGAAFLISFLLFAIYVALFLDNVILRRLKTLSGDVQHITDTEDISLRLEAHGNDELTSLTKAFNGLLDSLQHIQLSLRTERDQAETTLGSIADAVVTTDLEGNIEYINKAAQEITGASLDKCHGDTLTSIFNPHDEFSNFAENNLALRAISAGESIRDTLYCFLENAQGEAIIVESIACPIQHEDGVVSGAVIVFRDVSNEHHLQKNLVHQATHDSLTNLYNRAEFERQLEIVSKAAIKNDENHHLLFIDLDRFKLVNDVCGHIAGDQVLIELSRIMVSKIRASDIMARIGGDEFGILLLNCKTSNAYDVAEKIRNAVQDFRFFHNGKSFSFGASIGLVDLKDQDVGDDAGALSMADNACKAAKEAGRNRVQVFRRSDTQLAEQSKQTLWANRLSEALENDRFLLYFQKIVPTKAKSDLPVYAEILLRMQDDAGGVIFPGAFLPAAERFGLMKFIDKWVINYFCETAKRNPEIFDEIDLFSINLSGQSLSDGEFLNYLVAYFENPIIPPEKLCFEITETSAIRNISVAQKFIETLKEKGFQFSLDDFGSGMSSFGYLKHLAVDTLKIDGVFIKNVTEEPIDYAMVRSINEIGKVLGIKTVAEFVENAEITSVMDELGIDYLQGYHVHRPESINALLKHNPSTNVQTG